MKAMSNRPKRYAMCMSIDGFIRNNPFPQNYDVFEADDGRELDPVEAAAWLATEKAKGAPCFPVARSAATPACMRTRAARGLTTRAAAAPATSLMWSRLMADPKVIAAKLRQLSQGREEWRVQLRERGFYDCPELGKTCNRPGAYDAFSLPSLMGGKLVQPKGVGR